MSVSSLVDVEARIARALVASAIGAECSVSVYDGEAVVCWRSRDVLSILDTMASTDEDRLTIWHAGKRIGSVLLVYGNGEDLVSDVSCPPHLPYEGSLLERVVVSALQAAGVEV